MKDKKDKFKSIFWGSEIGYGTFAINKNNNGSEKQKGIAITNKSFPEDKLWSDHLKGIGAGLGIIPINSNSKCKWGCLDIDDYRTDNKELVFKIKEQKLPLIVCRSKSGGAHIFCYCKEFIPAKLMKIKITEYAAVLGIGSKVDKTFPVQEKILKDKGHVGSFLNLPYFNAEEGSRYAYKENGEAATLEEFFELYDKKVLSKEDFDKPLKKTKTTDPYAEAPPCLIALKKNKVFEGGRNDALTNFAIFYKKAYKEFGMDPHQHQPYTWQELTRKANRLYMIPQLEEKTVETIINSVDKKEYFYMCSVPVLKDVCQSDICRTRAYGIGEQLATGIIGDIVEYGQDRYMVEINTDEKNEITVDGPTLMKMVPFYDEAMRQGSAWVPKMKSIEFDKIMYKKFQERTYSKEYVEEANEGLVFVKHFKNYLNKNKAYTNKEALLIYKLPYFSTSYKTLEFNLDAFEDYLVEKRISLKRVDLVLNVQRILKARKVQGKVNNKSCVSWKIEKYDLDHEDLIVEGEAEEIEERKKITHIKNET